VYGSWSYYAFLQLFYPFKMYASLYPFIVFLFGTSLFLKLLLSIAILNTLHRYFSDSLERSTNRALLSDIGNVTAGIHHDIISPVADIAISLHELEQTRASDDHVLRATNKIRNSLKLISAAIKFIDLIRSNSAQLAKGTNKVNLWNPIARASRLFKSSFPNSEMRIIYVNAEHAIYCLCSFELLVQAFENVIKNAFEAGATKLRVEIHHPAENQDKVNVCFINNGPPLSAEELRNWMIPGWTSKDRGPLRGNTGLGAFMASRIARLHRGQLTIVNDPEKHVSAIFSLPRLQSDSDRTIGSQ
jgi:signal transduction histidine kinase